MTHWATNPDGSRMDFAALNPALCVTCHKNPPDARTLTNLCARCSALAFFRDLSIRTTLTEIEQRAYDRLLAEES